MHVFKKRKEKKNNNSSLPCSNKQMGDRKRYREYHRSGDAKIPRTTAWRFKKKQKQSFDGATTAAAEDSGMLNHIG